MEKQIDYKGYTATLTITMTDWHDILSGFQHNTTIKLRSPGLRCVQGEVDQSDIDLIEEIYTDWFKQIVDSK